MKEANSEDISQIYFILHTHTTNQPRGFNKNLYIYQENH